MLESIWVVRCAAEGRPYSSAQVVARFRVVLLQQLKQDWVRTQYTLGADRGVGLCFFFFGVSKLQERNQVTESHPSKEPAREWRNPTGAIL